MTAQFRVKLVWDLKCYNDYSYAVTPRLTIYMSFDTDTIGMSADIQSNIK